MAGVWDGLSAALIPHRERFIDVVNYRLECIERLLEHGNRVSDLGKPDSDDVYLRIIRKQKFGTATNTGANLLGRPKLGEYWLVQSIVSNGAGIKSSNAVLRTNAGALIASLLKESNNTILLNGAVVILPGEELQIEPEAEAEFDLTVTVVRRRIPQHIPDAGQGVAQGDDINLRAHSGEHEPERYIPDMAPEWQGIDVPAGLQPMSPGYGGAVDPDEIIEGEPVSVEPET